MRRVLVALLTLVFLAQSSSVSLAATASSVGDPSPGIDLAALLAPLRVAAEGTQAFALLTGGGDRYAAMHMRGPAIHHTPQPLRPAPDYRDPRRYVHFVHRPGVEITLPVVKPIDPTQPHAGLLASGFHLHEPASSQTASRALGSVGRRRLGERMTAAAATPLPPSTTGAQRFWTYEERSIPGVGKAMINVASGNLLLQATDVAVPETGLGLVFQRTYNTQSGHDATNDDGSTPSVYGNGWTNNFDVHIAGSNPGTMSVYDLDGTREDYTCDGATCSPVLKGVYEKLTPISSADGYCTYQWTRKSGTAYAFYAPMSGCGWKVGYYGRLQSITGRNVNTSIALKYSWSSDASSAENLTQITATHSDGQELVLAFGTANNASGGSFTELTSITLPDGEVVDYNYDASGDLLEVDKPGNDPVLPLGESAPSSLPGGITIPSGNLPETYDQRTSQLLEVCGPRATIALADGTSDGACVDFDYNANGQASAWWTRGVLNFTPADGTSTPVQAGFSQAFTQWNDTQFLDFTSVSGVPVGTELSDRDGHETLWSYDTLGRVTQTAALVNGQAGGCAGGSGSGCTWLVSSATWGADSNVTSSTDARGNTTNYGYDGNGNTVQVTLPPVSVQVGSSKVSLSPTSLYDYDGHNNVIAYCDAANLPNSANAWSGSVNSDTLCANSGATAYTTYTWSNPSQEPYGELTGTTTPLGYHVTIAYAAGSQGGTDYGLPTQVTGTKFSQDDGNARQPTQTFGYDAWGNLTSYGQGNGSWTIAYDAGSGSTQTNRVLSRTDPDGVTSYTCYTLDGSVLFTETAYQHELDNKAVCPGEATLRSGAVPARAYAVGYRYDADGDTASETHHHGGTYAPSGTSPTAKSADGCKIEPPKAA